MEPDAAPPPTSSSGNKLVIACLLAIIAVLVYGRFSDWRNESCRSHIGETTFIGTRTAIDASWAFPGGCKIKVKDTSSVVFQHVSPLEAEPDEWQPLSQWEMSLEIERSAKAATAKAT